MSDDDDGDDDDKPDQLKQLADILDPELERLRAHLRQLEDANSLFPATKAYLAMLGRNHVRDLTDEERAKLMDFLRAERDKLRKPPN
ncbi:MAG: hypothetical protein QY323_00150 [Patescibacteria group bacterium]|nr:MAG: hypothetical protein QY323_00150 [Patescibacteria group bacterium]